MEKKRIVNSWSKHNFPSELWSEILSCLPVKSLLQFRCVSMSWRSLIDDPNLCRSHLNNFKNNHLEAHLAVDQYRARQHEYVVYCSKTFTNSLVLDPLQSSNGCTNFFLNFNHWDIVCSFDGLVMLTFSSKVMAVGRDGLQLTLWNPSIRRARVLHCCPLPQSMKCFDLGFGFDPITKDYKHVRFVKRYVDYGVNELQSIELYTVGSGMWRTIQYQDVGVSEWRWNFDDSYKWKSLCCRGILYFTPSHINSGIQELVSFDLSSEVFASISFPIDGDIPIDKGTLALLDGGCSLGLANVTCTSGNIWVLEGSGADNDPLYWSKRYRFPSRIAPFMGRWRGILYIKRNGEMLVDHRGQVNEVTSYDLVTHEEKTLMHNHVLVMCRGCAYVESLLLLNG